MDKKVFSDCLKRNRETNKITIERLSDLSGISSERLFVLESGGFEKIKYSELMAISKVLDIPPIILMHGGGCIERHDSSDGKTYWIEY